MLELHTDHVEAGGALELDVSASGDDQCRQLAWRVTNQGPEAFRGVVRLAIRIPEQFSRPWFMVPGYFYGENRKIDQLSPSKYPRFDPDAKVPADMTSCYWDFPADRTAAPLVYAHQDQACFCVASDPHYQLLGGGVSGDPEPQVGVGFGLDEEGAYCRFTVPACEEPFTYNRTTSAPPTIHKIELGVGAQLSGNLRVYAFSAEQHGYQRVLESEYALLRNAHPAAPLPDIEPLVGDGIHGIVAGHYHESGNYFIYSRPYDAIIEQIANARGVTVEWHQMLVGFVGGFPICHGLLTAADRLGDAHARGVAINVANRICQEGISPSGLFWADYVPPKVESPNGAFPNPFFKDREEWGSGWLRQKTWVHSRTIADGCYHLAGMIAHEQKVNPESSSLPLWREALLGNLRVALDLQLPNGQYGQYYDAVERRLTKEDGCGGLLWIPAMLAAKDIGLGGPDMGSELAESVVRAGEAYAPYVEEEYIWGAPEDNDSPTSEDGMNAVLAYAELYRFTEDERFLELAQRAADWMLSFRKVYNQILPEQSLMGRYELRSCGGDFASSSNNHLHVFETVVTRQLCDLSRWTGNPYYSDRARDHWAFACQFLSRCDGMYNGFRGAMAEQFYWSDYGSWGDWQPPAYHHQKGNMAPFTAIWCIAVLLLAAPDAEREFES